MRLCYRLVGVAMAVRNAITTDCCSVLAKGCMYVYICTNYMILLLYFFFKRGEGEEGKKELPESKSTGKSSASL